MKYYLQQTTKLVTQLQQAHRLAAAFYMRILPLFDPESSTTGTRSVDFG